MEKTTRTFEPSKCEMQRLSFNSLEWEDSNANQEKSSNPGVKIQVGPGLEVHRPCTVPVI